MTSINRRQLCVTAARNSFALAERVAVNVNGMIGHYVVVPIDRAPTAETLIKVAET